MFWTYIIQNPAGRFYIGQTDDLSTRIRNHNRTDKIAGKFTRKNGPWILIWSQEHPNRSSAIRREREIKSWKSARLIRERLLNKARLVESRCNRD
jgi:putative endonuclease